MKCPHCDKEITDDDKFISAALRATCSDKPVEQLKYTSMENVGLAAEGTFVVEGELRKFFIVFDANRRLLSFQQSKDG